MYCFLSDALQRLKVNYMLPRMSVAAGPAIADGLNFAEGVNDNRECNWADWQPQSFGRST